MELQPTVVSPLAMDPYDSSSSSAESAASSVFDPAPPEQPASNDNADKVQFSFEDTNSNENENRQLIDRRESDYGDSGISPGLFEHNETRTLIRPGRSVSFKDV